ncbi:MAG: hypothetical protein U1E89_05325 [Burkholderiaceae bacterium]
MLADLQCDDRSDASDFIHLCDSAPPIPVPPQYVGPVTLPGSGRTIYWTGRVAIGLRHEAPRRHDLITQSALWLQDLMLGSRRGVRAA